MSSTVRRMQQLSAHMSSTANSSAPLNNPAPPTTPEPLVLFREQYASRIYTLNRPKLLNALNHEMVQMLQKQIKAWNESELCSSIIGTGNGHFCAGGDVKSASDSIIGHTLASLP
ncbi:hypothetical protein PIIN_07449 [Serendipita indica DSM 11827]|uniref:3-hydroxyisobutyryl-CoA hydrolase n=1 Tax=Serendipita indica (strain DSM 11827) TaxID=1109443 RepID=G4TQA3_SERID|nr:hypothetical protein PIIN_07449 [Serendipita indica DSM 11827]